MDVLGGLRPRRLLRRRGRDQGPPPPAVAGGPMRFCPDVPAHSRERAQSRSARPPVVRLHARAAAPAAGLDRGRQRPDRVSRCRWGSPPDARSGTLMSRPSSGSFLGALAAGTGNAARLTRSEPCPYSSTDGCRPAARSGGLRRVPALRRTDQGDPLIWSGAAGLPPAPRLLDRPVRSGAFRLASAGLSSCRREGTP